MLIILLQDLLVISLLTLIGCFLIKSLFPGFSIIESLPIAYPLGAGVLTWVLFLFSWGGLALQKVSFLILSALLLIAGLIIPTFTSGLTLTDSTKSIRKFREWSRNNMPSLILGSLLLAALAVIMLYIAVGRAYSTYDAIAIWSLKGYGIEHAQSIFGGRGSAHGLSYPLNIPIQIALFKTFTNDILPGSKLIFPIYSISLMFSLLKVFIRYEVRPFIAFAGIGLLATSSEIFYHSTIGYANLPLAYYLVIGFIFAFIGLLEDNQRYQLLGGILLALSTWTRLEGVIYVIALVTVLFCIDRIYTLGSFSYISILLPIVIVSGVWFTFYQMHGASGSQAVGRFATAMESLQSGDLGLTGLRLIVGYLRRSIFWVEKWGLVFPVSLALILLSWRRLVSKPDALFVTMLLGMIATGLVTVLIFYLGSFGIDNLYAWLKRSFPREFFPTVILLVSTAIIAAGSPDLNTLRGNPN